MLGLFRSRTYFLFLFLVATLCLTLDNLQLSTSKMDVASAIHNTMPSASSPTFATNPPPRKQQYSHYLWIFVSEFQEGISAWMESLAQLMSIAQSRGRIRLVLPHVSRGRLGTPTNRSTSDIDGMIPVTSLFDPQWMQRQGISWATPQEYQAMLLENNNNVTTYHICLAMPRQKPNKCPPHLAPKTQWAQERMWQIDQALEDMHSNQTSNVVLHIHQLFYQSLTKATVVDWNATNNDTDIVRTQLLDPTRVAQLKHGLLSNFHPRYHEQADAFLQQHGLGQEQHPITTIHWRAELAKIDYLQCARDLLQIRQNMIGGIDNNNSTSAPPFVLMSSIQTNASMAWAGASKKMENSTALQAIDLLTNDSNKNAFVKMEVPNATDMIETVIVELILATRKSTTFVTCARDACRNAKYCSKCNHVGKFGRMAVEMRKYWNQTSHPCWPKPVGRQKG